MALSRTLLAGSLAMTLICTPPGVLFSDLYLGGHAHQCAGLRGISLFCAVPLDQLPAAQYAAAGLLVIVATGLLPPLAALLLAYVAASFEWISGLVDGGDQVTMILALLTLPIGLTDWRLWAWSSAPRRLSHESHRFLSVRVGAAWPFRQLVRVQVAVIYLCACFGKLGTPQWLDGSAIYYWFRQPTFGPAQPLAAPAMWFTNSSIGSTAITWGTLVLEFSLAVSLLVPSRWRLRLLLPAGVTFHLGILVLMGISSFSGAMIAGLLLLLFPSDADLNLAWFYARAAALARSRSRTFTPARQGA